MLINMNFDFSFSRIPEIIFGKGKLSRLPELPLLKTARKVLIVLGGRSFSESSKYGDMLEIFAKLNIEDHIVSVKEEPSPELVDSCVSKYKDKGIDLVISIGGGSAIDAGKAISAMLLQEGSVMPYLEGVGEGKVHDGRKIPFIAIPTTAGTGSEATKNAVLSRVGNNGFKSSLRHDNLVPDIAILDPELTVACPKAVTAASGMDALCQLIGSYMSTKATPMTDALALSGMVAVKESLKEICTNMPNDIEKRGRMLYAAFASGVTLANAGLGIVHGFASSIGGMYNIPHGVICGTLLAQSVEVNISILLERLENILNSQTKNRRDKTARIDEMEYVKKYAYIGELFTNNANNTNNIESIEGTDTNLDSLRIACTKLVDYLKDLTEVLEIPRLGQYGVSEKDLFALAKVTSEKNNPVKLSAEQKIQILRSRL